MVKGADPGIREGFCGLKGRTGMSSGKRLYRSRTEKMIGGVCGGVADYLGIDVTVIRLLWVLVTLLGGAGVLAYLVLWIVIPQEPPAGAAPPA